MIYQTRSHSKVSLVHEACAHALAEQALRPDRRRKTKNLEHSKQKDVNQSRRKKGPDLPGGNTVLHIKRCVREIGMSG